MYEYEKMLLRYLLTRQEIENLEIELEKKKQKLERLKKYLQEEMEEKNDSNKCEK